MKKIIFGCIVIISVLLSGCKSDQTTCYKPTSTNTHMSSSFNQESYIWENFLFPTNRTTGVQ